MNKKPNRGNVLDAKRKALRSRRSLKALDVAMLAAVLKAADPDDDHPNQVERAMRLWVAADKFLAEKEREAGNN